MTTRVSPSRPILKRRPTPAGALADSLPPPGRRLAPLRARVSFLIHLEQLRGVHVRIALGRGQLDMTEQLLNRAQISASFEQVRRERVTERVRTDPEPRAARADVA